MTQVFDQDAMLELSAIRSELVKLNGQVALLDAALRGDTAGSTMGVLARLGRLEERASRTDATVGKNETRIMTLETWQGSVTNRVIGFVVGATLFGGTAGGVLGAILSNAIGAGP